jgi:hypothetical protein
MGPAAIGLLHKAASKFSSSIKQQNIFKSFWLPRLHMTFIRGTAQHILRCLPSYSDSSDVVHFLPAATLPFPSPIHAQPLPTFTPTTL